jgi:hypothetical protein
MPVIMRISKNLQIQKKVNNIMVKQVNKLLLGGKKNSEGKIDRETSRLIQISHKFQQIIKEYNGTDHKKYKLKIYRVYFKLI